MEQTLTKGSLDISKIRKFLTFEACQAVVHAFVSSRLDYCNAMLYGLPSCQLNRLQLIQNTAARIVSRAKPSEHVTPLLKQLHWLPIRERSVFKICLLTFKALHGSAPIYISDLLKKHMPNRPGLRSASDVERLDVPATKSRAQRATADRAFSICAPRLWNNLPLEVRQSKNVDSFKKNLKTFLFRKRFS